jgi:DUF2993 family protein
VRRVAIGVVALGALLVAADFGLRIYSQSVVANEVKAALVLSDKPSVSFGGWPFTSHLISGDLPSTTVTARTFSAHGVRLEHVSLSLQDVHFPSARLLSGGGGTIRAATGYGTAALTAADVTSALHRAGVPATVTLHGGRASVDVRGITVGLDVKVEGDALVLTPAAVDVASTKIPLPSIVQGLRYTAVKLENDEAVLSFRLRNALFRIPASS